VIATAPEDATFEVYPLASTTLAIVWAKTPTVLELEGDNLSTLPSWLDAMGPFGDINLSEDPLFPSSNPQMKMRPGPRPASVGAGGVGDVSARPAGWWGNRAITSIVGVSSSDAWALVDRWGGERYVWVRSDAFRRAAGTWQKVASTTKIGVIYRAAAPWKGGVLVSESVRRVPGGERLVAFGVKTGVVVPQPSDHCTSGSCSAFEPDALFPLASGELIALGNCGGGLRAQRWLAGATQGSCQAFELSSFVSEDPDAFARVVSADEVRLRLPGDVPGEEARPNESSYVDIELRFKGGRWVAMATKRAPRDPLWATIIAAGNGEAKPGAESFLFRGGRRLADGSALAWGELRVDDRVTAKLLLRSRAVASPVDVR
jgi:hypothetical protein